MIGGYDLEFTGMVSQEDLDVLLEAIIQVWPDHVIESAGVYLESLRADRELFIYQDPATLKSWNTNGLTVENRDGIIVIFVEEQRLSFVVADARSPAKTIVSDAIIKMLAERVMRRE